ncbi:MAG: M20/M25/M40 family metallo-hydrolase [archaeon]
MNDADFAEAIFPKLVDDLKALAKIAAPTFKESGRIRFISEYVNRLGVEGRTDGVGNLVVELKGRTDSLVVFSSHVDTVFDGIVPEIREEGGRLYGPGSCDNALGAVANLYLLRYLLKSRPNRTVHFVFNVCEEGLGNLKGIREYFCQVDTKKLRFHVCIEGILLGRITKETVGSRRFLISVRTAGGHSWRDYGAANAIIVASGIIAGMRLIDLPPATTLNVGKISGGTSVNSIPDLCETAVEIRSADMSCLSRVYKDVNHILHQVQEAQIGIRILGERPCGRLREEFMYADKALKKIQASLGIQTEESAGSTDSNYPLSQGLPSFTVGISNAEKTHSLKESVELEPIKKGLVQLIRLQKFLDS